MDLSPWQKKPFSSKSKIGSLWLCFKRLWDFELCVASILFFFHIWFLSYIFFKEESQVNMIDEPVNLFNQENIAEKNREDTKISINCTFPH